MNESLACSIEITACLHCLHTVWTGICELNILRGELTICVVSPATAVSKSLFNLHPHHVFPLLHISTRYPSIVVSSNVSLTDES